MLDKQDRIISLSLSHPPSLSLTPPFILSLSLSLSLEIIVQSILIKTPSFDPLPYIALQGSNEPPYNLI